MVSNCSWCQIVLVSNCPRCQIVLVTIVWCQIVRCQIVLGIKLSSVNLSLVQIVWCQIVRCHLVRCQLVLGVKLSGVNLFLVPNFPLSNCPVPNCPVSNCPGVKLSWCQIVKLTSSVGIDLSCYRYQPESHQLSFNKVLDLESQGPTDRTRDTWV